MPNDYIDNIKTELENQFKPESCIKKEPFIKLGSGQAPVLDYNIPQTACFNTYGHQYVKGIDQQVFKQQTKVKPPNNYFEVVQKTPEPVLRQRFAEAVQLQRTDDVLIPNSPILRKHLDLKVSNLQAVALATPPNTTLSISKKDNLQQVEFREAVVTQPAFIVEKTNAINEIQLTRLAKEGLRPMVMEKLGGYETQVKYIKEPKEPVPYFAIVEEYTTCSFLGDYGAGRAIKTHSLLPGETTTITVRTYKEKSATKSFSENVLDSFSESSTNEIEKLIENENGYSSNTTTGSSSESSNTHKSNVSGNLKVSLFNILDFGVEGGTESGSSTSTTNSSSATRASNVRSLSKALDKHVSTSNANRSIDVNTSTTESYKEGEEETIVRNVSNINKSRVLNIVFRQLLQQYITITYLSNIKVAFCNGYEESLRVVDIEQLDILLEDTVESAHIDDVRIAILKHYCTIFNYKDDPIEFIEKFTHNVGACLGLQEQETYWRIKKNIEDSWQASEGGLVIKVKGPILNVSTHTLKTSSLVADSVLGQGEALDCFNTKAQNAVALLEQLKVIEKIQQLEMLNDISDPAQRAELYKKVFGECCDTPQTQIIS